MWLVPPKRTSTQDLNAFAVWIRYIPDLQGGTETVRSLQLRRFCKSLKERTNVVLNQICDSCLYLSVHKNGPSFCLCFVAERSYTRRPCLVESSQTAIINLNLDALVLVQSKLAHKNLLKASPVFLACPHLLTHLHILRNAFYFFRIPTLTSKIQSEFTTALLTSSLTLFFKRKAPRPCLYGQPRTRNRLSVPLF